MSPKYSIIIPTKNGGRYLPFCIQTLLEQDFADFEIIISNNHSNDNTTAYLKTIDDKRVKIVKPKNNLTMHENYNFGLSYATGDWITILGDDDGVQPYFFELAELLTKVAEKEKITIINSSRAYFFWEGCQNLYKNSMITYAAKAFLERKNIKWETLNSLLGLKPYFELPQMYTTSMFNKSILQKVRQVQSDILNSTPPDANGAAISLSMQNIFLHSMIPLSWVGTSPKSMGFTPHDFYSKKHTDKSEQKYKDLKAEHEKNNWQSEFGVMHLATTAIILYRAILMCVKLQTPLMQILIRSKLSKIIVYCGSLNEINQCKTNKEEMTENLKEICKLNKIDYKFIFFIYKKMFPYVQKIIKRHKKRSEKSHHSADSIVYNLSRNEQNLEMSINEASKIIERLVKEKKLLEGIKKQK